ncbi:MAG: STAS/SEC14 domain-containing protein [Sphingomonadaceae bacterium]
MITVNFPNPKLAVIRPQGALDVADFQRLTDAINGHINSHDTVPDLLIHPQGIPHWASLAALQRHLDFIRAHQKVIGKIALVGDIGLLELLPPLVNRFVSAKVRHFPEDKYDMAIAWLGKQGDDPGEFAMLPGEWPDDVIALKIKGIITADDYRETLVPLVEKKLERHDKLKALVVMDGDYISYTADAALSDMRLGLEHWKSFRRMALVTDIGWMRLATRMFAPLLPGEMRIFALAELDEAKEWIKH